VPCPPAPANKLQTDPHISHIGTSGRLVRYAWSVNRLDDDLAVYCEAISSRGYVARLPNATLALILAIPMPAQDGDNSWLQMAGRAVQQSKLTLPGSKPFHLRAEIVQTSDPTSDYQAKVEEYWVSPEKWRRTIESPAFSQTVVVNGDKFLEKDTGDYFPWWLDDLVTAVFDPLPNVSMPKEVNPHANKIVPLQISSLCTGVQIAGDQWSLCFDPRHTLLTSAFNQGTGYGAEFKDFQRFGNKQVPRRIVREPAPGMKIQGTVTQLDGLADSDERMFAIDQSTPPQDRITRVRIDEDAFRRLSLTSTDVDWPYVGGPVTGACAVYVSADRSGHIREVWPGGCGNTGLEDPLHDQVMKWRLNTPTADGVPVQVRSRLTFAFKMKSKSAQP